MGHVHQLVDAPPVVPLKAQVEFRIAFQGRIFMNHGSVRHAWPTGAAQRHVVVGFVSFGGVIVEIKGDESFVQDPGQLCHALIEWWHRIKPAHRHLTYAVAVIVVECERILPIESWIRQRLRWSMDL
ncbi:MAG: hypothetical protein ACR2HX_22585 [Pyrinomonadaceae bacterium]